MYDAYNVWCLKNYQWVDDHFERYGEEPLWWSQVSYLFNY